MYGSPITASKRTFNGRSIDGEKMGKRSIDRNHFQNDVDGDNRFQLVNQGQEGKRTYNTRKQNKLEGLGEGLFVLFDRKCFLSSGCWPAKNKVVDRSAHETAKEKSLSSMHST